MTGPDRRPARLRTGGPGPVGLPAPGRGGIGPAGPGRSRLRPPAAGSDRISLAAVAALVAVLTAGLPSRLAIPLSGLAWVGSSAFAAWRCARRPGRGAVAWRLLAAGSGAWSLGCLLWTIWYVVGHRPPPFPSPADALFLAFPLLAVAGLLRLPGLPLSTTSRLRLLVDGTVVTAALLVLADLAGMARPPGIGTAPSSGRLAFVVLDVLAASLGLLVIDRLRVGAFPAVRRAAAAVVVVVLADLTYSAVASTTGYAGGGPLDALWVAGFLLLGNAAGLRSGAIDDPRPGTRLAPVVPAAAAGLALILSGDLRSGMPPVLAAAVVGLGAALTARQLLLAQENARLARSLEDKIVERTADLQAAVRSSHADARTDPLTGLPNRLGFAEALSEALAQADPGHRTAVVLLDLDRFQDVNDGLGHDVGDTVLVACARRLTGGLRAGQVLARLNGDEFGLLLVGLRSDDDAVAVARRLVDRLGPPLPAGPTEVVVSMSAGAAVRSTATGAGRAEAVRELMRDADTALNAAKADGGGSARAFDPRMHDAVRRRLQVQGDLRAALQTRQVSVHYQPVVDLVADRVVGVEALARWTSPVYGPVPPLEFIAAAERSGLVVELERQVLDLSCGQLVAWRRQWPALTVAVNVSARHLREPDFLDAVMSTLAGHRLPPTALVVEVTESLLFHDDEQVRLVLDRLRTAGVGLALDDFGTGYSSLSRLTRYPFDTLKVDRAFVTALDAPKGAAVLAATLSLARALGMRVVAEGVETPQQLQQLARSGCELAQGYLLSRPGCAENVGRVLGRRLLPAPRTGDRELR